LTQETFALRPIGILSLFAATFICANLATAQGIDVYGGAGTATADSNGVPTDTFGDGTIYIPPKMGGAFLKFGGTFMFTPHFGAGAETSFRASQGDYAGLKYKPTFYEFNGVYHPIAGGRVVPEFQAGLGGVNLKFYYTQQYCDIFAGCQSSNSYLESSNHFQVHFSAGVKFYVKNGFYVKPQVDAHWVNNFFQFGSSWVPEYGGVIGYTFGGH
jgi:hypothetical protein